MDPSRRRDWGGLRAAAWVRLHDGKSPDPAAELEQLDSRWVVVTAELEAAVARFEADRHFRRSYQDSQVRLYELVDAARPALPP